MGTFIDEADLGNFFQSVHSSQSPEVHFSVDFSIETDEFRSVMLHDEIVIIHHDGHGLTDNQGQPNTNITRPRAQVAQ